MKKLMNKEERNGELFVTGTLLEADAPDVRGVVITREAIQHMFDDWQKRADAGDGFYGWVEPNKGQGPATLSHYIEELKVERDFSLSAKCKVLDTPAGLELQRDINAIIVHEGTFGIDAIVTKKDGNYVKEMKLVAVSIIDPMRKR